MSPVARSLAALLLSLLPLNVLAADATGRVRSAPPEVLAPLPVQATPAPADPAAERQLTFNERVADFIERLYLSGEALTEDELAQLYAARVTYFGGGIWSRERIIADKRAYYARWHRRSYALLRDTLKVEPVPGQPKVYDIRFEYTFDVTSRERTSRGRGRSHLTFDLANDSGRITRETGDVIQRW